jgi:hypothetical protein
MPIKKASFLGHCFAIRHVLFMIIWIARDSALIVFEKKRTLTTKYDKV